MLICGFEMTRSKMSYQIHNITNVCVETKSSKIKPSCVVVFILATISSNHLILNPQIETQPW